MITKKRLKYHLNTSNVILQYPLLIINLRGNKNLNTSNVILQYSACLLKNKDANI